MPRKKKVTPNRASIAIRVTQEYQVEVDELMKALSRASDLAKIHNDLSGTQKYPDKTIQYILEAKKKADKIIQKLEPLTTKEDWDRLEAKRKYLREYYRGYRKDQKKDVVEVSLPNHIPLLKDNILDCDI